MPRHKKSRSLIRLETWWPRMLGRTRYELPTSNVLAVQNSDGPLGRRFRTDLYPPAPEPEELHQSFTVPPMPEDLRPRHGEVTTYDFASGTWSRTTTTKPPTGLTGEPTSLVTLPGCTSPISPDTLPHIHPTYKTVPFEKLFD
jgi:hypothetical protein